MTTTGSFEINVVRSKKRKKYSQAQLVGDRLDIRIPNSMTNREEAEVVEYFMTKFEKRYGADRFDLQERAEKLAARYGLETPTSIRWVRNQNGRWGSCSVEQRTIRLSEKMITFPEWVIDYVIIHELAHLSVPAHNKEFWRLVDRYPKTERARGYLIAMAHVEQG